jgi:hypothetical protein
MNEVILRKRRIGYFNLSIVEASETLKSGGYVGLVSIKEDGGAERLAKGVKEYCGIDVEITRTTRKEPLDNRKLLFDEMGECIGVDILPQTDKFTGWILKPKK